MPAKRRPRAVSTMIGDTYTERQWAAVVEGLLTFYGWRWHHAPDNKPRAGAAGRAGRQRVGDRGFPDYVAIRRLDGRSPELAFLELKTETGRLGPGQREWLEEFAAVRDAVDVVVAEVGEAIDARARELTPRMIVGVFRPSQRRDLEAILAGPRGRNVYIGRDEL